MFSYLYRIQRKLSGDPSLCLPLLLLLVVSHSASAVSPTNSGLNGAASVWPSLSSPERRNLERVTQQQELRILTPFQPHWYLIENGKPSGALLDLQQNLQRFLTGKYGNNSGRRWNVTLVPTPANKLQPWLVRGFGDVALSLASEEPDQQINLSAPLNEGFVPVWVSGPAQPAPVTWTSMADKSVLVRADSHTHRILVSKNDGLLIRGYQPLTVIPVDATTPTNELLQLVKNGDAPALAIDGSALWGHSLTGVNVDNDLGLADSRPLSLALRSQNKQLLTLINEFISQYVEQGGLPKQRKQLSQQTSTQPMELDSPRPSPKLVEQLQAAAKKYQFDWRLLQAFVHRQSWFNQQARSHNGAIGVMQITTAMASEVDIKGITQQGNNVEAGAKYLAKLKQSLFGSSPNHPVDATLITMAAYEAGLGRIERLQQMADQRGFDPNRWHGNLEHIVLAEVGSQATASVDAIYRYYLKSNYQVGDQ